MAFNLSMNASEIDKTLVESRQLLDSEPATKQYVDEKVANAGGSADLSEILDEAETDTWTTEGKTAAFYVVLEDGFEFPLYKMPNSVEPLLSLSVQATVVFTVDGETQTIPNEGVPTADTSIPGTTGYILGDVTIAIPTEAGEVDFGDGLVITFPEPGVYYLDLLGGQIALAGESAVTTFKFSGNFTIPKLKEDLLPNSVGTTYVTFTTAADGTKKASHTGAELVALIQNGGCPVLTVGYGESAPGVYFCANLLGFNTTNNSVTFSYMMFVTVGDITKIQGNDITIAADGTVMSESTLYPE